MLKNHKPIKDRLDTKLDKGELLMIKQALWAYLAKADPEVKSTRMKNFKLENLLLPLQQISSVWDGMTDDDFLTSYKLISSLYYCVNYQF